MIIKNGLSDIVKMWNKVMGKFILSLNLTDALSHLRSLIAAETALRVHLTLYRVNTTRYEERNGFST